MSTAYDVSYTSRKHFSHNYTLTLPLPIFYILFVDYVFTITSSLSIGSIASTVL